MEDPNKKNIDTDKDLSETKFKRIFKFVSQLPNLSPAFKDGTWLKDDLKKRIYENYSDEELEEKYRFYDQMAEIINFNILPSLPPEKAKLIHEFAASILNQSTDGHREIKREKIMAIQKAVNDFKQNHISLKFLVEKNTESGEIYTKIFSILNKEAFEITEKLFPNKFWTLSNKMSPQNFPNFSAEFNFSIRENFSQENSLEAIEEFPEKLKKGALSDTEEIIDEFFSEKEKDNILKEFDSIDLKEPIKILEFLLNLKEQKKNKKDEALKGIKKIKSLIIAKNPKAAQSEIEEMKTNFGDNIIEVLGEKRMETKLEVSIGKIKNLEDQLEKEKDPKKQNFLQKKLRILQDVHLLNLPEDRGNTAKQQKEKIKKIMNEIEKYMNLRDFNSAEYSAHKLYEYDSLKAYEEISRIKKERAKKENKDDNKEKIEKTSESKESKIEFYEDCIEHARYVKEECALLGIPTNDPSFWKLEGVKKRVPWLREHGLWETYRKFNANDKNMPKRTYNEGFRFRWLDARTGNNMSAAKAEDGQKYLDRYKESGYALAALAGAFSINWKGNSSPLYTPDEFISRMQKEISDL